MSAWFLKVVEVDLHTVKPYGQRFLTLVLEVGGTFSKEPRLVR